MCFGKEDLRGGKEGGLRRCIYGEQKYAFSVKILMSFEPHWICNKCLTTIVLLYQSRYNALSNSILSNNTLVCFNPDMMLYVFLSMYCTDTTRSRTQFSTNNTSVCINPNMMLYVFFSVYRSDTTRSGNQFSPIILQSVSIQIELSMYFLVCIVQIQFALELYILQ